MKLTHVNKKITTEKAHLCLNNVVSHYFKNRAKKFHAAKPRADVQFKFLFLKQKLHLERTMSELGKPFPKKISSKNIKNWKWMPKCRMWTKNH